MSGISRGYAWPSEAVKMLVDLRQEGMTFIEISDELSVRLGVPISVPSVENKVYRLKLPPGIQKDPAIKVYEHKRLPDDNYMVSCDYHAPFHSERWVNRLLSVAAFCGIRKHIIVGDLFDCDWAKAHPSTDGEQRPGLDGEAEASDPLVQALLQSFDLTVLICGNHETRAARNIAKVQFRHIAGYVGLGRATSGFMFSEYDKLEIGSKWLLVHPRSYSQISGAVAIRLAEKYHRHVLNAHGHFAALRYDRSGDYMGIDLGGMFDVKKVGYIGLHTTVHPNWNPGFAMLLDGHVHHFHAGTDFSRWERQYGN